MKKYIGRIRNRKDKGSTKRRKEQGQRETLITDPRNIKRGKVGCSFHPNI